MTKYWPYRERILALTGLHVWLQISQIAKIILEHTVFAENRSPALELFSSYVKIREIVCFF